MSSAFGALNVCMCFLFEWPSRVWAGSSSSSSSSGSSSSSSTTKPFWLKHLGSFCEAPLGRSVC